MEAAGGDVGVADDDLVVAVPHDGDVGWVKGAAFDQVDLAATAFLERTAHDVHVAGDVITQDAAQGDACGSGDRADQVVAAGVADLGQGVIFGEQGDAGAGVVTSLDGATEGDVHVGDSTFDFHAVFLHEVHEQASGTVGFPAELRVGMDVCCDGYGFCLEVVYFCPDPGFEFFDVHL